MHTHRAVLRKLVLVALVVLSSTTLTACHELYCNFVEGLTGEPVDCSHDAFPDLGDITLPSLPPPPTLPTTTLATTTTAPATTTTSSSVPGDTTSTTSTTSTTITTVTTIPTSTSTTSPG